MINTNGDKPVAIGPTSKTVIGDDSPSVASLLGKTSPLKNPKKDWKRLAIPVGLIGIAVYVTMKYKGHV